MTPSLIVGDGNWAVKSDSLLGYKIIDGKYYPREMTFTRATTGTRVNEAGLVELVPYNLLSWSEQFDNAAWSTSNRITVASNTTTAPNGTLTADSLIENTALGSHYIGQPATIVGTQYNLSVYAKINGRNRIALTEAGGIVVCIFNISNGTIVSGAGNIENVGNGWYRCSATYTAAYTSATINLVDDSNNISYTGNGTSGVYLWGGQLVEGTQPLDYLPTTTRLNIPRIDYSTGEAALLLEPQRTNLALQSASFDSVNWTKTFGGVGLSPIVTANAGISPDGLNTADRIQFNLNGGTAVGDVSDIRQLITTTATSHTFSFYAKSFDGISTYNMLARDANGFVNAITVTSTWTRFTITATYAATSSTIGLGLRGNQSPTNPNTADILIWGAQLEAGDYPTSYIPTTSATVTRNRDQCVKTGITDFIGQTEGTLFINAFGTKNVQATGKFLMQILGSKNISITFYGGNINVYSQLVDLSVPFTPNQIYKIAVCYSNSGNFRIFVNGVKTHDVNTYASGTYSDLGVGCRTIGDGPAETSINSAQLYKVALTDVECITLTTL